MSRETASATCRPWPTPARWSSFRAMARPAPSTATAASFENTMTIRRPIAAVFAFLADFENIPAWNYAILETRKVSPGPVAANLDTLRQILERDNQRGSG